MHMFVFKSCSCLLKASVNVLQRTDYYRLLCDGDYIWLRGGENEHTSALLLRLFVLNAAFTVFAQVEHSQYGGPEETDPEDGLQLQQTQGRNKQINSKL